MRQTKLSQGATYILGGIVFILYFASMLKYSDAGKIGVYEIFMKTMICVGILMIPSGISKLLHGLLDAGITVVKGRNTTFLKYDLTSIDGDIEERMRDNIFIPLDEFYAKKVVGKIAWLSNRMQIYESYTPELEELYNRLVEWREEYISLKKTSGSCEADEKARMESLIMSLDEYSLQTSKLIADMEKTLKQCMDDCIMERVTPSIEFGKKFYKKHEKFFSKWI